MGGREFSPSPGIDGSAGLWKARVKGSPVSCCGHFRGSTWQSHVPSGACGDSAPRPSQQGMCRSDHQPRPSPQSNDSAVVRHRVMGSLPIQKDLHFQVETGGPGTGLETASLPWPQRGGLSRVTMCQRCAHRRVTQAALGTPHSNSLFLPNLRARRSGASPGGGRASRRPGQRAPALPNALPLSPQTLLSGRGMWWNGGSQHPAAT